ncbi:hypothetical protein [Streptomyces sp. NPDC008125]|uniref:hypothetical protein n=1 Tax=Streptomyces sp. NPDC008125 TaxID=3364811 RepID=UPI0036E3493F
MQEHITRALLALVPGARWAATRVTVEHAYTQLDVQSRDTWSGSVDGLAARLADALSTEKDIPAGTASTPAVRPIRTAVLVALARALRDDATADDALNGLAELGEAVAADAPEEAVTAWADAVAHLARLDDAVPASDGGYVYRAEHDAIHMGHYATAAAARAHCEGALSDEHPAGTTLTFDWLGGDDPEDPEEPLELVATVAEGPETTTGYLVVPVPVAAAYDPDADQ